jgi:hypothetical protein
MVVNWSKTACLKTKKSTDYNYDDKVNDQMKFGNKYNNGLGFSGETRTCFKCNQVGHLMSDCPYSHNQNLRKSPGRGGRF